MSYALAASVLFLAAALTALWGRTFRADGDPLVAERWFRYQIRSVLLSLAAAMLAVALVDAPWPALAVAALPRWIGMLPARRRLLGETWPVHRYLGFMLRLTFAMFGFWIALALLPWAAGWLGGDTRLSAPLLGLLVALLLSVQARHYDRVIGAQPLLDRELEGHLRTVSARARCREPAIYRLAPAGGTFANALAIPSTKRPRVVLGQALLDNLRTDEIEAIFAHELAHLEHFDARRLRRVGLLIYCLLAAAVTLGAFVDRWSELGDWVLGFWPVAVIIGWLAWAISHQSHEGESDLRGAQLCGDGEAMISALVKLHALARLPRRVDPGHDAASSHPSLARRIKALRRALGPAPATRESRWPPLLVRDARDPETAVLLDREGVRRLSGLPAGGAESIDAVLRGAGKIEQVLHRDISSMNIEPSLRGTSLKMLTRGGQHFRLWLAPEDIATLQDVLDRLDHRFASERPAELRSGLVKIAAVGLGLAVLASQMRLGGFIAVNVCVLAALFRPGAASLGALAAVSLALLSMLWLWPLGLDFSLHERAALTALLGIVLPVAGFTALWVGRRASRRAAPLWLLLLLGLPLLPGLLLPWLVAPDVWSYHSALQAYPSWPLLAIALSVVLWRDSRVGLRRASGPLFAAALVSFVLGSQPLREHVVDDPFVATASPFAIELDDRIPMHTIKLPGGVVFRDRLAPSGRWAAAMTPPRGHAAPRASGGHFIGRSVGGDAFQIDALDLAFVDDTRVLVLDRDGAALKLSIWRLPELRQEAFTPLAVRAGDASLAYDGRRRRWSVRVAISDSESRVFEGELGRPADHKLVLRTPARVVVHDDGPYRVPVLLGREYSRTDGAPLANPALAGLFGAPDVVTTLWAISEKPARRLLQTRVHPRCVASRSATEALCFSTMEGNATLFDLDLRSGFVRPVGRMPTRVYSLDRDADTAVAASSDSAFVLDVARRRGVELRRASGKFYGLAARLTEHRVAVVRTGARETLFEVYDRAVLLRESEKPEHASRRP